MGAKVTADLVREQHISKEEGTYLLGFCNNVSPGFFYQLHLSACAGISQSAMDTLRYLLCHAGLYGICHDHFIIFLTPEYRQKNRPPAAGYISDAGCLYYGQFRNITRLGGYIILFSVLRRMMQLISPSDSGCRSESLLEISCGIHAVCSSFPARPQIWLQCCACASFGGLVSGRRPTVSSS